MAYDGLVNYTIVKELSTVLINGKVDKIFEPNFEEIVLSIYSNGTKYALNFVTNSKYYRANLTTNAKPNPNQAPAFCMTLRKHLLGTHINKIYTNNLERIIFIEFDGFNKSKDFSTKKLIVEWMGKHINIILVNSNEIIIDSLKHFSISSGSYRNIFAGEKYVLPKSDKIDFMEINDDDEFFRILHNNSQMLNSISISNIISNVFTGISKNSALSFENELGITDELNSENSNKLFQYIKKIIVENCTIFCKTLDKGYSLSLKSPINDVNIPQNLFVNFFLDDYYTAKEKDNIFNTYRNNLLKLILGKLNKLKVKLDDINKRVQDCKDADRYRLYGELITSNLYKIKDEHIDKISLDNYYDNNLPITILLDRSITPAQNAKKFFKKYQKLKNAMEYVEKQKQALVNDINYLESVFYEIESAKSITEIDEIYSEIQEANVKIANSKKRRSKSIKPEQKSSKNLSKNNFGEILKFNVDGFTVLVGKNNKQNDYITTKLSQKEDLWFHVKDFQGSHVVLKTENKLPSQDTIVKCAELAKTHSKVKDSSNVVVDYTYIKFVKKPNSSKPGMVIYTNNKSVIVK